MRIMKSRTHWIVAFACFVDFVSAISFNPEGGIQQRRSSTGTRTAYHPPASPEISYRPYAEAPESIKQLLQFQQAREPLVHIASQPAPQLSKNSQSASGERPQYATQYQTSQYKPQVQFARQPQFRDPSDIYQTGPTQQRPPQGALSFRPNPQHQVNQHQQPQYANSLPPEIQQFLNAQGNQHSQQYAQGSRG